MWRSPRLPPVRVSGTDRYTAVLCNRVRPGLTRGLDVNRKAKVLQNRARRHSDDVSHHELLLGASRGLSAAGVEIGNPDPGFLAVGGLSPAPASGRPAGEHAADSHRRTEYPARIASSVDDTTPRSDCLSGCLLVHDVPDPVGLDVVPIVLYTEPGTTRYAYRSILVDRVYPVRVSVLVHWIFRVRYL